MTLFTDSQNNLHYFADLILQTAKGNTLLRESLMNVDEHGKITSAKIPFIEVAYKAAVIMQGGVYFGPKKEAETYLNIGDVSAAPLASTCATLGEKILQGQTEPEDKETKIIKRFKVGWFIINSLIEDGKLEAVKGRYERDPYIIKAIDREFMDDLFYLVNTEPLDVPIYSRPVFKKPKPFKKLWHPVAGKMVRGLNKRSEERFEEELMPKVYEAINKHQSNAYVTNTKVLEVLKAIKDTDDIMTLNNKDITEEQREGMEREMKYTMQIAEGTQGRIHYFYNFYDFRGRLYNSAVYYSNQGSKLAKSLVKFAGRRKLGAEGKIWLYCHAANSWGFDKASMDERAKFAEEHLDEWLVWAEDPINYKVEHEDEETGEIRMVRPWTLADDPFGFLAAILEIYDAHSYKGGVENFGSNLIVAWDATCSGLQILSSLMKSEKEGALANISKSEVRGDYYKAIAQEVWKDCVYTPDEEKDFNKVVKKLAKLNKDVFDAEDNKAKRKKALDARKKWQKENKDRIWAASKVFWGREVIAEQMRKICKRPCMTYFYSCRERTMSKQLLLDWKSEPEFKGINAQFCFWLCVKIVQACKTIMPDSTRAMEILVELANSDYGKKHKYTWNGRPRSVTTIVKYLNKEHDGTEFDRETGRAINTFRASGIEEYFKEYDEIGLNEDHIEGGLDFTLEAPFSKFFMMFDYREDISKRISVTSKSKRLQINLIVGHKDKLSYKDIVSAASPNIVHMLDAEIVKEMLTKSNYRISCIHDSFGTYASNAGELYEDLRTVFAGMFNGDLMCELIEQKNISITVDYGSLNVNDIIDNEFAFS